MKLFLFTASFPFVRGNEASFLGGEVQHLRKAFDYVMVIPEEIKNPVPVEHDGIEINTSYSEAIAAAGMPKLTQLALVSPILRLGMFEKNFPRFSYHAWRRLIAFSGKAELTRRWILNLFQTGSINPKDSLFYTYWFYHAVTGIAFARKQHAELKLVTRAHGYDIFAEEYYSPPFFPCREITFPAIDRIFPDSEAGSAHLRRFHPEFASRIETSLLGVEEPGFLNKPSADEVFRIVTCSMIRPEKRIDLIFDVIKYAAELRPSQKIEWIHIGNGDLRVLFQQRTEKEFPSNARAMFPGYSNHAALMKLYAEKPFDLFVNLSETEGTPVSIMEAISCGIPVLATAVGGNAEIVSEKNGILVDRNADLDEIVSGLFRFIDFPTDTLQKRNGSREIWESHYNAHRNFFEFSQKLRLLRLTN